MIKSKSLELLAQGKDAWNAWALDLLEQRKALEEAGEWNAAIEQGTHTDHGHKTNSWLVHAYIDFSKHTFPADTSFNGLIFPGPVNFTKATFERQVNFNEAAFFGNTLFDEVEFKGKAWFESATFHTKARFKAVVFHHDAAFRDATFLEDAWFEGAVFRGNNTEFYKTAFHGFLAFGKAEFNSARFTHAIFHSSAMFHRTVFHMTGNFSDATFLEDATFADAVFHWKMFFTKTKFHREVDFRKVTFHDPVSFERASFDEEAKFDEVVFQSDAVFDKAVFNGEADFDNAAFQANARFVQCRFAGHTVFSPATFKQDATFTATDVKSAFRLDRAEFAFVPDFVQAHFAEAPTLDSMRVGSSGTQVQNETARWRALKRIAIQAHDHDREQTYFASELRARRGAEDRWWQIRYWFGWLYQILSNFGSSVLRPTLWWLVSTVLFAVAYLGAHFSLQTAAQSGVAYVMWTGTWLGRWLAGVFYAPLSPPSITCVAGTGDPAFAALLLSLRKALLFAGLDASSKADQTYACLYGIDEPLRKELGGGGVDLIPFIPDGIIFLGLAQTIISAALLFLFLLALRNAFKIR